MTVLKKILNWIKHYWYIALTALAVGISLFLFRDKTESLLEAMKRNHEDYKEHSKETGRIHDRNVAERDANLSSAREERAAAEKEHQEELKKIKKEKEELEKALKDDEDLASKINEEFGL